MVQGRVLFGAEFHFFILHFIKHYLSAYQCHNYIRSSRTYFYSIKMKNRSPVWCPKILLGPFRWLKSYSVFSRTAIRDNMALCQNGRYIEVYLFFVSEKW